MSKEERKVWLSIHVTIRIKEITGLLNDQTVKEKLVHEVPAFDKFKEAHFDYWFKVKDAGGFAECCDYLSNRLRN